MITDNETEYSGYLGNPLLKKPGEKIEFTHEMLMEYGKCMNDPIYFAETYMQIVHVDHGQIPIKLYDYQKEIISSAHKNRFVICNTGRQQGKCVHGDTLIDIKINNITHKIKISELYNINKFSEDIIIDKKFVDSILLENVKVLADTGWERVSSIHKTVKYEEWVIETKDGMILTCADDHIVFNSTYKEVFVKDLTIGDSIITENGVDYVSNVTKLDKLSNMYDITVESENHRFYTNGILSHNTTTAAAIILHYILFNESKTVALLANKADSAREIMDRIQLAYQNLPKWLQQGVLEWNKGSLRLENGCKVLAASSSASSIRGKSISFLYIDEIAFVENFEEFYSSVYPTVTSGKETKVLFTSTPKGLNHFYKFCTEAQVDIDGYPVQNGVAGKNGFIYHEVMWDRVPGRDEAWKETTLAGIGYNYDQFAQEYCCSFMGSSDNLISSQALSNLVVKNPIVKTSNMYQYEPPKDGNQYALIADVSRGKNLDYSAFSIINVTSMPYKQVCVFRSNEVSPLDYAAIIYNFAKQYNDAMVMVEVNDIGGQVADSIYIDYGYENLISTQTNGRSGKKISGGFGRNIDRGIRTSEKVKIIGCSILKLLIEQQQLLIHDAHTINELKRFSKKGSSYAAEQGAHDDLVMTLVLFAWMSDQGYFKEMTEISTLNNLRDNTDDELNEMMLPFFYSNSSDPDDQYWKPVF